jgi:hypothetical protein
MTGKKYFTSLDAAWGYWQVPIHPADRKFTGFICQKGLFEFKRMPFGLKNAPATYQRMMDVLLKAGIYKYCHCYIDDVLIYSDTFEDHLKHVEEVMTKMFNAGLLLKAKKCTFCKKETEFLGHTLSADGITMQTSKLKKVANFPVPSSTAEVHSFLGLTGYYRKFVKDYASIVGPLYDLIRHNYPFSWSEERQKAFDTIVAKFQSNVVLQHPKFDAPYLIDVDASDSGIGAVLSQVVDRNEKPLYFASRKLSPQELKWPVRDKEALGIVYALECFRHHILGRQFKVRTDHHSLTWLMEAKKGRLARWAITLSEYEPFEKRFTRTLSSHIMVRNEQ